MGRGDRRGSMKMQRIKSRKKKKERAKRVREAKHQARTGR